MTRLDQYNLRVRLNRDVLRSGMPYLARLTRGTRTATIRGIAKTVHAAWNASGRSRMCLVRKRGRRFLSSKGLQHKDRTMTRGCADRSNSVNRCRRRADGLIRLALPDRLIVQTRLSVHPRTRIRTAQPCRDRQTSGLHRRRSHRTTNNA
jgi:hypothetical protein